MSEPSTERIEVGELNKLTNAVQQLTTQSIQRGEQLSHVISTQEDMKKDIKEIKDERHKEAVDDALLKRDVDDLIKDKETKEVNTKKIWVGVLTKISPYVIIGLAYIINEVMKNQ